MNSLIGAALTPVVRQCFPRSKQLELLKLSVVHAHRFATSASAQNEEEDRVRQHLRRHDINVKGFDPPPPILDFESSDLPPNILKHVLLQFEKPTPIQSQALPIAMRGMNMVGIGQTGSGKTLAFLLPALTHIQKMREARRMHGKERTGDGPDALILTPTRELALQIQEVAQLYRKSTRIGNVCCIGGESRMRQLRAYDYRPQLMIATPGRLKDFLEAGDMTIRNVDYVVLDEADRMLDMGFEPQIRAILKETKPEKQVLMFSATWPDEVKELAEDFLGEYTFMNIGSTELSANKNITQEIIVTESKKKHKLFTEKITELEDKKILIFAEKKVTVDWLERNLRRSGVSAMGIHGDKSQMQRSNVIRAFKRGTTNIMIATDVAARGLDISGVEYVINYDFPKDIENYIHRIGRTGRSDNKGTSVTFVSEEDANSSRKLISILKESNQSVPEELYKLSRFARETKGYSRFGGTPSRYSSSSRRSDFKPNQTYRHRRSHSADSSPDRSYTHRRKPTSDIFY